MFESLESRTLMSASTLLPSLGNVLSSSTHTVATLKVAAKVDVNVVVRQCTDAKVLAKLGLCTTVKLDVAAKVDAIIGLCSKLKVAANGNLCSTSGVAVDAKLVLGVLARLGAQTTARISDEACVSVLGTLGVKASVSATISAKLNSCYSGLSEIGASIHAKAIIGLRL